MIDKYPALIIRCTGVADVISAVNFARKNELLVVEVKMSHEQFGNEGEISPVNGIDAETVYMYIKSYSQ
jgi:hypothetical protein